MSIRVWRRFDGGSIEVVGHDGREVLLALAEDAGGFRHAFSFRARGPGRHRFRIVNAGASSYPGGWAGYRVCASDDGRRWFRIETELERETLAFAHRAQGRVAHYATFPPYGEVRRSRLLGRVARHRRGKVWPLGKTAQGRLVTALVFGEGAARVWVIARQHPGEVMGEWLAEGLAERLLRRHDPEVEALGEMATVAIVPCMNPDGAALGYHRTNAEAADLNRSWDGGAGGAPEVAAVRRAMAKTGVDLFLDVHGDETEDYCFLARSEGNPRHDEEIAAGEEAFVAALLARSPDFQDDDCGYPPDAPGEADLSTAAGWVGARFACPAMTLEMPFKDVRHAAQPRTGWSPERSRALGGAVASGLRASVSAPAS